MRMHVLSSGSKGNLTFLETAGVRILVDVGLSCKEATRRLQAVGVDPESLDAILVTHEHSDHIRGVSVTSRRYKLPVWIGARAWKRVSVRETDWFLVNEFRPERPFCIGDLEILPFRVPHDAADPVAYRFQSPEGRAGLVTDLGHAPEPVVRALLGSDLLVLESNHDETMLETGPYPDYLKRRIRSHAGHLSNTQSAELLDRLWHPGLKGVVLGHLSEENNRPELALAQAARVLEKHGSAIPLFVARQDRPIPALDTRRNGS